MATEVLMILAELRKTNALLERLIAGQAAAEARRDQLLEQIITEQRETKRAITRG